MTLYPVAHVAPKLWSDDDNARLTKFWTEKMPVSELARRFHCSKGAITRQVNVLGLPARPSPIRPPGKPKPPKPLAPGASTLPPLPSQETQNA